MELPNEKHALVDDILAAMKDMQLFRKNTRRPLLQARG
jgi:hypothetical protein